MIKWKSTRQEIFFTEILPPVLLFVVSLIMFLIMANYKDKFPGYMAVLGGGALSLLPLVMYFVFKKFRFPPILKIVGYSFIFLAITLASGFSFYTYYSDWDTLLHILSGILCSLLAFYFLIITGIYQNIKEGISCLLILLLNASTSSIWEIIEFIVDTWFFSNAQHSLEEGVVDTMEDMIANGIGGLVFIILMVTDILINKRRGTDFLYRRLSIYTKFDYRLSVKEA